VALLLVWVYWYTITTRPWATWSHSRLRDMETQVLQFTTNCGPPPLHAGRDRFGAAIRQCEKSAGDRSFDRQLPAMSGARGCLRPRGAAPRSYEGPRRGIVPAVARLRAAEGAAAWRWRRLAQGGGKPGNR